MPDRTGQQLGNYRLTKLLGSGGFADVYLGEHILLKSYAAIKVLHTQIQQNVMTGFLQEAQTIERLRNPYIVRFLDFGKHPSDDLFFLIMEYAPQGNLRDLHPRGSKVPLPTIVTYVKQVANALQHAHDEQLIHCDIKPENILVTHNSNIIISDFGLSTIARHTSSQNMNYLAGTAQYMAPEQFKGKPRPATDQYALAITAYEWLCGEPPFTDGNFIQLGYQHTHEPIPPLKERGVTVSPEVEQVLMKGLAKEYAQRYATMREFAEELEKASKPQAVKPPAPPVVVRKVPIGTTLLTYKGHSDWVRDVAWSPYGQLLASAAHDHTVQVWEAATGKRAFTYSQHNISVGAVAWSPDGKCLASASNDHTVQVWDAATGKRILTYSGHTDTVWSVAWSPDGKLLASSGDKTAQVWNARTGQHIYTYKQHSKIVGWVAWSPDGKLLASASSNIVQIWSMTTTMRTYSSHNGWVQSVVWAPTGDRIASASEDKTAQVWEAATGRCVYTYEGHSNGVWAVAWSHNGNWLASASRDKTVQVWDAASGQHIYTYRGHSEGVRSVAWSLDDTRIASASEDNTVQVWQAV